jgi:nitrite reductase/ring-hydroxylating ferredoxin subunit
MDGMMSWNDHPDAPEPGTILCTLDALADGLGTGFDFGAGAKPFRLFVVRRGKDLQGYVNACAHFGIELNPGADHTFLTPDGAAIRCQHHGARYAIEDGRCLGGACDGDGLTRVPVRIRGGDVVIGE